MSGRIPRVGGTAPSGTASGDLSGTYPSPVVAQVNGAVVPASAGLLASNSSRQLTTVTVPLASSNGGTGNGFTKFSGPTTSEKTFTLPDSSATLLTSVDTAYAPIHRFSVQVSSAQLKALPFEILASPGLGKMYFLIGSIFEYKAGATPYGGTTTYLELVPTETAWAGSDYWNITPMATITNAADQTTQNGGNFFGYTTSFAPSALNNKGVSLVADGTVTTGNGTLWITVYYTIETQH